MSEEVEENLLALLAFAERQDLPGIAQAAVAHAQFEGIHPLVDGNGRVGRALIHAVLRRRRLTTYLAAPVAAGLVAAGTRYTSTLNQYRKGDPEPVVVLLAEAVLRTTQAAQDSGARLLRLPEQWRDQGDYRRGLGRG